MNIDRELIEDVMTQLSSSSLIRPIIREALRRDDIVQAFKAGKKIEYREKGHSVWGVKSMGTSVVHFEKCFNWEEFEYRIAETTMKERRDELLREEMILGKWDIKAVQFLKELEL